MCRTFPWRRHCLPQQEQEGRRSSLQLHQQVPGKRLWRKHETKLYFNFDTSEMFPLAKFSS